MNKQKMAALTVWFHLSQGTFLVSRILSASLGKFKYKAGSQNERLFSVVPSAGKSGSMHLSASASCRLAHTGEALGYAALPRVVSEEKCKEAGQGPAGSLHFCLLWF